MIKNAPPKHPESVKWYWMQWSTDELQGASISTSQWTVPVGITLDQAAVSGYSVGIKLSGGTLSAEYEIENKITSSNGESLHEQIRIRISKAGH